ncbi:hypothetical protein ANO14919_085600 [Xylariales sp. No.14919]|nr:hypothetical protein ANO14919_085600 [Xylariales sp. No.14919]
MTENNNSDEFLAYDEEEGYLKSDARLPNKGLGDVWIAMEQFDMDDNHLLNNLVNETVGTTKSARTHFRS